MILKRLALLNRFRSDDTAGKSRLLRRYVGRGIVTATVAGLSGFVCCTAVESAGEMPPSPAAGVMPQHIPPLLVGRLETVSPESSTLRMIVIGNRSLNTTTLNIIVPGYIDLDRLTLMDGGSLHRGESIMVQGTVAADNSFGAKRIIRLAKRAPLAPGITLMTGTPAGAGSMQTTPMMVEGTETGQAAPPPSATAPAGTPPAGTPLQTGAGFPATIPPAAATGPKPLPSGREIQRAKIEAQAQKFVHQAAKRGVLIGQIVSSAPLVMEAYDGSLWNVNLAAGGVALNQARIPMTDLKGGDSLLVKGSETGSGTFRASEINVLPPGVSLIDPRGGKGRRR